MHGFTSSALMQRSDVPCVLGLGRVGQVGGDAGAPLCTIGVAIVLDLQYPVTLSANSFSVRCATP